MHTIRLAMVLSAKKHRLKSTDRTFHVSPNTVRK